MKQNTHRGVVLGILIVFSVVFLLLTFPRPVSFQGRGLISLVVVVIGAIIGGVAFSWKRYLRRG